MTDLRLWRAALLAVPVATIIAMFSLQEVPRPLQPALPPDAFDGTAAAALAKQLARSAPEPRPGSDSDEALAELVKARFASIAGAEVAEQTFEAKYEGEDVELRNLILILPGQSDRQVALIAGRDSAVGSGATTSIASTAAMLEAAASFSGSTHDKTLVFVSTDGDSIGALGTRRFVRDYSDAALLDAAFVVSQPASPDPKPPLVVPWSIGPESTASQLVETAISIVSDETGEPAGDEGPLDDLFRLAIPAGLGGQGPMIEAGLDAIRVSSSGELPPSAAEDEPQNLNPEALASFGRASLALMLAIDATSEPVEHGPAAYIGVGGNLLPGWTLTLLALSLLAPVAITAGAGLAAAARSPGEAARGALWTLVRVLPFLASVAVVWFAALVGLLSSPEFPFDPAVEGLGTTGTISVLVAVIAYGVFAFFLRPLAPPPPQSAATASSAAVLLGCLATLGILAANPYLALLVALGLQLWLLAAAGVAPGRPAAAGLVVAGLIPVLAAIVDLAGRFGSGLGVWQDLLFMYTGGQISGTMVLLACTLGGVGVAVIAASGRGPAPPAPSMRVRSEREEPGVSPESEAAQLQPEPEEPEPEEDSRLWSKPLGSSSPPPGRRRLTPSPSVT